MIGAAITMEYLRGLDTQPRVHGNGFIQLDLANGKRLHFWGHPDIPRQVRPTPIHDHTFGFQSWCLRGRLVNIVYDLIDAGIEYQVYRVQDRNGEDTELVPTDCMVGVMPMKVEVIVPAMMSSDWCVSMPSTYKMGSLIFHETFAPEPTITCMEKTHKREGAIPHVLSPTGVEPDNEFNRHTHDPKLLWRIIEEMMDEGP